MNETRSRDVLDKASASFLAAQMLAPPADEVQLLRAPGKRIQHYVHVRVRPDPAEAPRLSTFKAVYKSIRRQLVRRWLRGRRLEQAIVGGCQPFVTGHDCVQFDVSLLMQAFGRWRGLFESSRSAWDRRFEVRHQLSVLPAEAFFTRKFAQHFRTYVIKEPLSLQANMALATFYALCSGVIQHTLDVEKIYGRRPADANHSDDLELAENMLPPPTFPSRGAAQGQSTEPRAREACVVRDDSVPGRESAYFLDLNEKSSFDRNLRAIDFTTPFWTSWCYRAATRPEDSLAGLYVLMKPASVVEELSALDERYGHGRHAGAKRLEYRLRGCLASGCT